MNKSAIIKSIQAQLPEALAIYAFGSQIHGTNTSSSDLDLAVLVPGYTDPLALWQLANQLANQLEFEVDLLDFRAASTIMQNQILHTGERWWHLDSQADAYEAAVLSEMTNLKAARGKLLATIAESGTIYE